MDRRAGAGNQNTDDGSWHEAAPIQLFNGKDTSGWLPVVPNQRLGWTVKDGILSNVAGANNLMTNRKFWNFKLHVEFRLGPHSNSGIGLRGRYEVQILDDIGRTPNAHRTVRFIAAFHRPSTPAGSLASGRPTTCAWWGGMSPSC